MLFTDKSLYLIMMTNRLLSDTFFFYV